MGTVNCEVHTVDRWAVGNMCVQGFQLACRYQELLFDPRGDKSCTMDLNDEPLFTFSFTVQTLRHQMNVFDYILLWLR